MSPLLVSSFPFLLSLLSFSPSSLFIPLMLSCLCTLLSSLSVYLSFSLLIVSSFPSFTPYYYISLLCLPLLCCLFISLFSFILFSSLSMFSCLCTLLSSSSFSRFHILFLFVSIILSYSWFLLSLNVFIYLD
uniref:Uncharacterized protein n=1 Tax=Cacopsylla melanoneura TaxID=428564 RepID=A0A8D9EKB1_9HEMI